MYFSGIPTLHKPAIRFGTGELEPRRKTTVNLTQQVTIEEQRKVTKTLYDSAVKEMSKSRKTVKNFAEGFLKGAFSKIGHAVILTVFGALHIGSLAAGGVPLAATVPAHVAAHALWAGIVRMVTKGEKTEKVIHNLEHMNVPKNLEPIKRRIMEHAKEYTKKLVPEGQSVEIQDGDKKSTISEIENTLAGARLMVATLHELRNLYPQRFSAQLVQQHLQVMEKWVEIFEKMKDKERISELDDETKKDIAKLIHRMLRSQDPEVQEAGKDTAKLLDLSGELVRGLQANPHLPPGEVA